MRFTPEVISVALGLANGMRVLPESGSNMDVAPSSTGASPFSTCFTSCWKRAAKGSFRCLHSVVVVGPSRQRLRRCRGSSQHAHAGLLRLHEDTAGDLHMERRVIVLYIRLMLRFARTESSGWSIR